MTAALRARLTAAGRREAIRSRLGNLPEGGFAGRDAGDARILRQGGDPTTARPAEDAAAGPAARTSAEPEPEPTDH